MAIARQLPSITGGAKQEGVVTQMFLGEVVGTAVLVLIGDGVVAGVLLNKSKSQNGGWIVITWAWALGVLFGVITSLAVTGGVAQLNPAVTIGLASIDAVKWADVPTLIAGQFVGAFIGATLVYLAYLAHWAETEDPGLKLAVFSTGPAIRNTVANLITEIIGTFMLVFGIVAIVLTQIIGGSTFGTLHCGTNPGGPCNESTGRGSGERACPGCQTGYHTYAVEIDRSSCSGSVWRSVVPPVTPSTLPETSARGSCTPSCRSPAREVLTGRTRGSPWSDRSWAASSGH